MSKRLLDIFLSAIGLVVLAPFLLLIGFLVKGYDNGPVLYRQMRVGEDGLPFFMLKFRSMIEEADRGSKLTIGRDRRITPMGHLLRKTKLDELPQLWNVLMGEMSMVGPRPEVPHYVESYTPEQKVVLELKPGITDPASFAFYNESEILAKASDPERFYIDQLMPEKIRINLEYARKASLRTDLLLIFATVAKIFSVRVNIFSVLKMREPGVR